MQKDVDEKDWLLDSLDEKYNVLFIQFEELKSNAELEKDEMRLLHEGQLA